MFKFVFVASVILAAVHGSRIDDYENLIDYGQSNSQFPRIGYEPYAYQRSREERVAKPLATFIEKGDNSRLIVPVPVVPEVAVDVGISKLELIAKAAKFTFALGKKAIAFVLTSAPGLILGSLLVFGFCKFTPFCSKLSKLSFLSSFGEVQREIQSYATPERLASASEFVQSAIRKYRSLQDSDSD